MKYPPEPKEWLKEDKCCDMHTSHSITRYLSLLHEHIKELTDRIEELEK